MRPDDHNDSVMFMRPHQYRLEEDVPKSSQVGIQKTGSEVVRCSCKRVQRQGLQGGCSRRTPPQHLDLHKSMRVSPDRWDQTDSWTSHMPAAAMLIRGFKYANKPIVLTPICH